MMNNKNKIIAIGLVFLAGAAYATQQYLASPDDDDLTQGEAETAAEEIDELPLAPLVDELPLAPLVDARWKLTASYYWSNPHTATDITYIFDSFFNVVDGKIKPVGLQQGSAFGDAGINVNNGDCLETQPLEIEFTYILAGKVVKMAKADLIGENDFSQASVTKGQLQVLEVELKTVMIDTISLPPWALCSPDLDQEFRESLVTFWFVMIQFLEVEYRNFPLAAGVHCPGTIIIDEGGTYNELTPCYNLIDLKNP
jgi:hypothetical protein